MTITLFFIILIFIFVFFDYLIDSIKYISSLFKPVFQNIKIGGNAKYINGKRCITYTAIPSEVDPNFVDEVREILLSSDLINKYSIIEVPYVTNLDTDLSKTKPLDLDKSNLKINKTADITINLLPRSTMETYSDKTEYYSGTKKKIWFSYTWQHPKPHIAIDGNNWLYGVPESKLSVKDYRKYVILHEFMHGLGYDHQPCNVNTAVNGMCPVLYQATRGPPAGFKSGTKISPYDFNKKISGSYF